MLISVQECETWPKFEFQWAVNNSEDDLQLFTKVSMTCNKLKVFQLFDKPDAYIDIGNKICHGYGQINL